MNSNVQELINKINQVLKTEKDALSTEEKSRLEKAQRILEGKGDSWLTKENIESTKEVLEVIALLAKFFLN